MAIQVYIYIRIEYGSPTHQLSRTTTSLLRSMMPMSLATAPVVVAWSWNQLMVPTSVNDLY